MIADLVVERASDNIEATYLAVGSLSHGAMVDRWEGGVSCQSSLHHPVSNFAIVRSISSSRAKSLRDVAVGKRAFNTYVLPGPNQNACTRIFEATGFRRASQLQMMVEAEPLRSDAPPPEVASTFDERLAVCRFMARQFFPRQTSSLREAVALATAKSPVDLVRNHGGQIASAAMLSKTPGFIGVYNLCVEASQRDKGWGSELLAAIMNLAAADGCKVTLQCEPSLEPWYLRRGFVSVGAIFVMTLER